MSIDSKTLENLMEIDMPEGMFKQVVAALVRADQDQAIPTRTARQDRNKRYYENRKAREVQSICKTSEASDTEGETQDVLQDASPSPASPQRDIIKPPITPSRSSLRSESVKAAERAFDEEFWPAYPRRVGKDAARKAFVRIVVSERSTVEAIVAGARALAGRSVGKDAEFIPHPATWLNAGRFDDEEPANGVAVARPAVSGTQVGTGMWLRRDDPRFEAWAAYKKSIGKTQAVDGNGGWLFPTEKPPAAALPRPQTAPQLEFSG